MNLTNNFTLAEFNFRELPLDKTLEANALALAENLQAIRNFLNTRMRVTSWYRPMTVNRNAGGSKTSQHLHGEAVDFVVYKFDAKAYDNLFKQLIEGTIKLPHACSQIIRETKDTTEGKKEWIHMGIKTLRWLDAQNDTINSSSAPSAQKSKATKRLTHCECLVTRDAVNFELVKYIP
jgi:hypothetical protein